MIEKDITPQHFNQIPIVFMGTPAFAVASLEALVKAGCNVVGVITAPDKPSGRGLKLQPSAVKEFAIAHHLPILQPIKLRDEDFLQSLRSWKAQLQVVVAFRMLPEVVWNMPPLGTVNVHASLLPQYRGAAPINWAIINGEKETGITTFQLQHQIDTGNILLQQKIAIEPQDNAGSLHDKLMHLGATMIVQTVQQIFDASIEPIPQNLPQLPTENEETVLKHAPKIFTETCTINWDNEVTSIHNLIRGLSPYPGAFTKLNDKILKIFDATPNYTTPTHSIGDYDSDGKTYLKFACKDGYLIVDTLQFEGKKKMSIVDFLRGHKFNN